MGYRFKWCQDRNVKLLDEYDQVNHDMKKLWASSPEDLRAAQAELEHRKDTYTLGKTNADDDVSILTHNMTAGYLEWSGTERAKRQMNLIITFKKYLPAFRMTWSLHDGEVSPTLVVLRLNCCYSSTDVHHVGDAGGYRERARSRSL